MATVATRIVAPVQYQIFASLSRCPDEQSCAPLCLLPDIKVHKPGRRELNFGRLPGVVIYHILYQSVANNLAGSSDCESREMLRIGWMEDVAHHACLICL